ncbi:sigma-70 family RNA polymerase sigma factor [Solibacillus sp. FSL R7-0682]|uniref:sigma-70 family RNA polymerase sigma factor n=1 Tax=Solibacillus sp. FSL R7-0682 TaxID=2921690 RepID=UPI0030FB07C7
MLTNEQMHELMDTYSPYLLQISYMYVKDFSAAEDIVQDVFIHYFKTAEQFEGRSSIKTYLTRMTIHKCTDYLRSWASRKRTLTKLLGQKPKVSYEIDTRIEHSPLMRQVLSLPFKYRESILLFYYEEMTTQEIAQLLSLSENTVKTRLRRARELLKERTATQSWEELADE